MRRFRLKNILIIGLLVCSVLITVAASAQEFPPEGRGKPGMAGGGGFQGLLPFLRLNLLQDQQKDLLDIFEKYHVMRTVFVDNMMALDQEMADVMDADTLDEEYARAVFKKQANIREEMMILEMKMNREIKAVLSSEQLELLKRPERPGRPFPPLGE